MHLFNLSLFTVLAMATSIFGAPTGFQAGPSKLPYLKTIELPSSPFHTLVNSEELKAFNRKSLNTQTERAVGFQAKASKSPVEMRIKEYMRSVQVTDAKFLMVTPSTLPSIRNHRYIQVINNVKVSNAELNISIDEESLQINSVANSFATVTDENRHEWTPAAMKQYKEKLNAVQKLLEHMGKPLNVPVVVKPIPNATLEGPHFSVVRTGTDEVIATVSNSLTRVPRSGTDWLLHPKSGPVLEPTYCVKTVDGIHEITAFISAKSLHVVSVTSNVRF